MIRSHRLTADRGAEFVRTGLRPSLFFPHRFYCLPKPGPDGLTIARSLLGDVALKELWEIVLYAEPPVLESLPRALWFDDELVWHQQQYGRERQVAAVSLVLRGDRLYAYACHSDVVQRVSRHREHKTRVEKELKGWMHMLLNAILHFADAHGCRAVYLANAQATLRNTDRKRCPQPELYERLYDRTPRKRFEVDAAGDWWRIDLSRFSRNRERIVRPERHFEPAPAGRTIAVCHDVERHWGHPDLPAPAAAAMEATARHALPTMVDVERSLGVPATYHLVGLLFGDEAPRIRDAGHAIAFHSFDHRIVPTSRRWNPFRKPPRMVEELYRCRTVDYRLKGYRPPQSRIGETFRDENLALYNFEWLASGVSSLGGIRAPRLPQGVVKIPIHFDDYPLYRDGWSWERWEKDALAALAADDFVAFSLHDCYADRWLRHYERFLEKVVRLGELKTLDRVAAEKIFSSAW